MIKKIVIASLLISSVILTGCAPVTSVRQHSNLQQEAERIKTVIVLPPDVTIELLAFTGENKKLTDKQDVISKQLTTDAQRILKDRGADIVEFDFDKATSENPELAFAIKQCKEAMAKSEKTLYKKSVSPKEMSNFKENIGPAANMVAEITSADAFLLIQYNGFQKTAGMVRKDIAAGVMLGVLTGAFVFQPEEGSAVHVALIAANSGAVLWTNQKSVPQLNISGHEAAFAEFPQLQWKPAETAVQTAAVAPTMPVPPATIAEPTEQAN